MLPEEDQWVLILHAQGLHDVALTIGLWRRGPAGDRPSFLGERLNLKKTVGSVHVYSSGKLRAL
ncbi:hypothetical protein D3C81_1919830 [compost metagenome]